MFDCTVLEPPRGFKRSLPKQKAIPKRKLLFFDLNRFINSSRAMNNKGTEFTIFQGGPSIHVDNQVCWCWLK